jgi:FAD/FMN-containing dehydrogenase
MLLPPRRFSFAFEPIPAGPLDVCCGIGLYFMTPRRQGEARSAVDAVIRQALARCLAFGGRPYLHGAHALDLQTLRRFYGTAVDELQRLKRCYDPAGVLTNRIGSND